MVLADVGFAVFVVSVTALSTVGVMSRVRGARAPEGASHAARPAAMPMKTTAFSSEARDICPPRARVDGRQAFQENSVPRSSAVTGIMLKPLQQFLPDPLCRQRLRRVQPTLPASPSDVDLTPSVFHVTEHHQALRVAKAHLR